ncbi:MAG: hypothetical protein IT555_01285 [Acetobacteraceae bacterium]|nr:hypothetical protein [Acetobacteraceae bacterium]
MRMRHRRAHRRIWAVLALVLPALFLAALMLRPGLPREEAPVRIAPPAAPR